MVNHKVNLRFSIRYVYIGIFLVLLGGVIIFYYLHESGKSYGLLEIVTYITGSIATLTLIYHAFNLENQIKNQEKNNAILKSKHTYDLIHIWIKPDMAEIVHKAMDNIEKSKDVLQDSNKVEGFEKSLKTEERKNLFLLLNYFENIGIMIEDGFIDEKIMKMTFIDVFNVIYTKLKLYINETQKQTPGSWSYFEALAVKWNNENKKAT